MATHGGHQKHGLQRGYEAKGKSFGNLVGRAISGLCGIDMAILLQNDQVFEESKSNIDSGACLLERYGCGA